VRRTEEPRDCTRCFPQDAPSGAMSPNGPRDTFMTCAL
jgi:hypothetical protein